VTRSQWRWLITVIGVLVLSLSMAACGDEEDEGDGAGAATATQAAEPAQQFPAGTTMKRIQDKGEIVIGVKYDVPPFGFKNTQSGAIEGFDVDFGKAIADKLGVKPKLVEALSDNRIPFITDGTVDLVLSTMTINPERAEEIGFTNPYFIAHGRILQKKGGDITGVKDLAGKKVCTALGSTYEETLKKQAPRADLRLVDSYSECLELIQNGAVDAVSTDDVILTGMIIQDDSLEMVGEPFTTEPYGIGIPEGDKELKAFVDEALAAYKEDGRWDAAYQKWVGQYTGVKQKPPTMSLQEAIALAPLE